MRQFLLIALALPLMAASRPPLVDAAKKSDRDTLRTLIQKKTDVNAAEPDGSTALHWVSYRDDVESADALIRAGANVNASNDLGVTPLWTASQNGSVAMVKKLLEAKANPNAALLAGETPLMIAARSGYVEIVEQLIAKDANVNAHGARGQTALMWAVSQKHPDVVKVLLAHNADIKTRSAEWHDVEAVAPHGVLDYNRAVPHGNETAFMFAARVGDLESAKLLLAAGANVNDADAWGVSAVTLAAHSGFDEMVDYLLAKKADPNAAPNGFTALHEAIMRRDEHMVAALLDHGANPNAPLKTWTPTRRSSDDFHFEPPLVGATPLWMAARFLQPGIMRLLVKHGADPLFVHHSDYMADGAVLVRRVEQTTILMAATGMIRVSAWVEPPKTEREALMLETAKLAVEMGVDLNLANSDGRTAVDSARILKYDSVVKFLTEKGGKAGKPPEKAL